MLLVIDAGNTNTVFAIAQNNKIFKQWRINSSINRTADEYSVWLIKLLEIENLKLSSISNCIVASVVPEVLLQISVHIKLHKLQKEFPKVKIATHNFDKCLEAALEFLFRDFLP